MNKTLTQIATVIFCLTYLNPWGSGPLLADELVAVVGDSERPGEAPPLPREPVPDVECFHSFDCPGATRCDRRDNQCYKGLGHGTA